MSCFWSAVHLQWMDFRWRWFGDFSDGSFGRRKRYAPRCFFPELAAVFYVLCSVLSVLNSDFVNASQRFFRNRRERCQCSILLCYFELRLTQVLPQLAGADAGAQFCFHCLELKVIQNEQGSCWLLILFTTIWIETSSLLSRSSRGILKSQFCFHCVVLRFSYIPVFCSLDSIPSAVHKIQLLHFGILLNIAGNHDPALVRYCFSQDWEGLIQFWVLKMESSQGIMVCVSGEEGEEEAASAKDNRTIGHEQ